MPMSPPNAGEVASRMAIETNVAHVRSPAGTITTARTAPAEPNAPHLAPATNQLTQAIRAANAEVFRASWKEPRSAGMGTTVAAARLSAHLLSVAHVGDSRIYLIREESMQPLTADHSWVAEQVAQGYMTEEEAERSPRRNIVTRAVGVDRTVDIDVIEMPVFDGDLLLLCSDGLTRGVKADDILRTVQQNGDLHEKTDRLIALANDAGGDDNVTVMLIVVGGEANARVWQRLKQRWFSKAC